MIDEAGASEFGSEHVYVGELPADGKSASDVFHFGLVDILSLYEFGKKLERASLVVRTGVSMDTASVMPPEPYRARFLKFVNEHVA